VSRATFRAALEDTCLVDFSADLQEISAPTLVIWGDQDAFCPRAQQDALLAAIPRARLLVHEGAGHAMHWEDPVRVAAELAGFVEEVRV
jgi:non-heme chloroperoxidase